MSTHIYKGAFTGRPDGLSPGNGNGLDPELARLPLHPEHLADLVRSGLSAQTIQAAKIHSVSPREIPRHLGFNDERITSVLCFPYFGEAGFCRDKVFPTSLTDRAGHKIRYLQRKGSGSRLYIPPRAERVLADPTISLYFTEGEKKALKAAQQGHPTIGLAGLWNFTSQGELLPGFSRIKLAGREVGLIPDSEVWTRRKDLLLAVYRLGRLLEERGAKVYALLIAEVEGQEKWGSMTSLWLGGDWKSWRRFL